MTTALWLKYNEIKRHVWSHGVQKWTIEGTLSLLYRVHRQLHLELDSTLVYYSAHVH